MNDVLRVVEVFKKARGPVGEVSEDCSAKDTTRRTETRTSHSGSHGNRRIVRLVRYGDRPVGPPLIQLGQERAHQECTTDGGESARALLEANGRNVLVEVGIQARHCMGIRVEGIYYAALETEENVRSVSANGERTK